MPMDTYSSSDYLFFKEEELVVELLHREPSVTRTSFPYQSLLVELHTLDLQLENFSSTFSFAAFTRPAIRPMLEEVRLQRMIFNLLLNHGIRSESLDDIQTMAEIEAERIQKLAAAFTDNRRLNPKKLDRQLKFGLNMFRVSLHQKIKPPLKEFCLGIVDPLLQGNCSTGEYGIFTFINVIFFQLKNFINLKQDLIYPVKKQTQILEQMLNYAPLVARNVTNLDENLQIYLKFFEPWVNTAAAIVILYWAGENPFALVSSSLHKFNLNILEKIEAYILVMKALRPSNVSEIFVMRSTIEVLTEMILEKFTVFMDDRFHMFREALAFWTTLVVDPPKSDAEHEKLICSEIHVLLDQAKSLICSLCQNKLGEDVAERRNTLLNDFLEKISKAKVEVRQLQVHQNLGFSCINAPKVNSRRRFDLLLGNLQKKFEVEAGFLPFEKHLIAIVHEELSLLRPSLLNMFELQDEHKELRDICVQASNIAYFVDYAADFFLSSIDFPIWSNLIHLSNAIEKIQPIKTQISNIRESDQIYNDIVMNATKLNSQCVLPLRHEAYDATTKDDFKVGFVEEEQSIIDFLVAREAGLNIAAVVGMGGQGKTHLAQRVFQDKRIKHHFHKLAWCCISQAYDIEKVFGDIVKSVGETVSPDLTQQDLAEKLRKCLIGQKYLVVLDDMWDAKAWFDLEESFPDERNGSRILLTSRNIDVALKVKANCSIVELEPLSHEESWNLLQMKVFRGDYFPPILSEIGKTVAENCKGLPLAVVLVAGLLEKDKNVDCWKQISESLKAHMGSEGCMDIIEMSYKHLPDYLKPCFLYLGAFGEDEIIDAKKLIQFWIAEGFVQIDGKKTREVVAKEYLMELVSRSLVFVAQRSSRNGIKKCRVHDLLHQLCLIKVEEERFLLVPNDVSDHSSTLYNDHHRILLPYGELRPFLDSNPIVPGLRSLLVSVRWFAYDYGTLCFLKELKLIRVLDLSSAIVTKDSFHYITQLIHLRLLALVCKFPIPPSIVNLLRLEVLRLDSDVPAVFQFESKILPSVVLKMVSLRHIFAGDCTIEHTKCYDKFVPDMSSPLTNLETLTTVCFYSELSFKRVAQSLQNMLKFGLKCWACFRLSSYFKRLESLKLNLISYWPHKNEIISPSILDFPSTLKKLNLTTPRPLSCAMLSSIGKLSHLEVLKLNVNFEDDMWEVEDDEFLQLKYLDIRRSSVQEWNVSEESFPRLEQLLVRYCYELGELPARFGSVFTLTRIEVSDCSDSLTDSFQQIVDEQMDAGNNGLQYSIFCSVSPQLALNEWIMRHSKRSEIRRHIC